MEAGGKGSLSMTHLGTTGSSSPFLALTASFHRAVQRHHLHPGSRPMLRKLLPREAEKSRNSRVRRPVCFVVRGQAHVSILAKTLRRRGGLLNEERGKKAKIGLD